MKVIGTRSIRIISDDLQWPWKVGREAPIFWRISILVLQGCGCCYRVLRAMLSASQRQPHLLHVSTVDRRQTWSMGKSWRCVTLSGFLHSHIIRCRWNPISCGMHYSGPGLSENDSAATTDAGEDKTGKLDCGSTTKVELNTILIASLPSTDLWHQLSAIPSTMVCAIPGEMEEGERRHHIIRGVAMNSSPRTVLWEWWYRFRVNRNATVTGTVLRVLQGMQYICSMMTYW